MCKYFFKNQYIYGILIDYKLLATIHNDIKCAANIYCNYSCIANTKYE